MKEGLITKQGSITVVAMISLALSIEPHAFAQRIVNNTLTLPIELETGNYELEEFDDLNPVLAIASPPGESNELYFGERRGSIIVYSDLENEIKESTPFLDISSRVTTNGENGLLGFAFHPNYQANRQFFLFYTTNTDGTRTNRLSRFLRSESNQYLADPNSETILIDQIDQANNHNGGDIHFGPDGYLYVALGDEGGANDNWNNGQRVDKDFFAGMLRIDVDRLEANIEPTVHPAVQRDAQNQSYYKVPADNPLISRWQQEGSDPDSTLRLEFSAIGLRNPWRMAFDSVTGNLWVGDVGQGAFEEVCIVEIGGNYGWAFREGTIAGPKNQTPPEGFETVSDPYYEYGRSVGNSITGGVVYRGSNLPELEGAYVFGDYGSGRVFALFPGEEGAIPTVEQIASFPAHYEYATDPSNGDVLISGGNGTINRLVKGQGGSPTVFPASLSDTGAFKDLSTLTPEDGILSYEPNVSFWSDHAIKKRWVSIPNSTVGYNQDGPWDLPTGSIWIKHFELETERGNPSSKKRIETRFLVKTANSVYGLSYKWNEVEDEAHLVSEEGENIEIEVSDNGSTETQNWRIPSRTECIQCHTAAAGYALSFNTRQLNNTQLIDGESKNLLQHLGEIGILNTIISDPESVPRFSTADDESETLEHRVRSYIAVNCASCHIPGGGAPNTWDARPELPLSQTGLINGSASNDGGDSSRRLVVRGDPDKSVLLSRVKASHDFTRMPPLATSELDDSAISLLKSWISLTAPADSTFEEWQILNFGSISSPDAAFDADPDSDDNPNILEFLNRTKPLDSSSFWKPSIEKGNSQACIQFSMAADRSYEVEISSNLIDWDTWNTIGNPPVSHEIENIDITIKGPLPQGADPSFLRVRVTDSE